MSTLRQAAQRALKAMEDGEDRADMIEFSEALIALRAALAEPEQPHTLTCVCGAGWDIHADGREELAAAPTPRKPLTDEEISSLWDGHTVPVFGKIGINPIVFARAIEAAHGIGEQHDQR